MHPSRPRLIRGIAATVLVVAACGLLIRLARQQSFGGTPPTHRLVGSLSAGDCGAIAAATVTVRDEHAQQLAAATMQDARPGTDGRCYAIFGMDVPKAAQYALDVDDQVGAVWTYAQLADRHWVVYLSR